MKIKDLLLLTIEEPPLDNSAGIYAIYCVLSDRVYIGSSKNIYRRWKEHQNSLKKGKHCNFYLQDSWNKHGEKFFVFHILEICKEENLLKREHEFIKSIAEIDKQRVLLNG